MCMVVLSACQYGFSVCVSVWVFSVHVCLLSVCGCVCPFQKGVEVKSIEREK